MCASPSTLPVLSVMGRAVDLSLWSPEDSTTLCFDLVKCNVCLSFLMFALS